VNDISVMQSPNGRVAAAARQESMIQGENKLSDEQSPLASSTLRRCLVSCFVQMRPPRYVQPEGPRRAAYCRRVTKEGARARGGDFVLWMKNLSTAREEPAIGIGGTRD